MQFDLHELELPVRLRTERPMTDEELMRFSRVNEPLRIQQESIGDLVVMSRTGERPLSGFVLEPARIWI